MKLTLNREFARRHIFVAVVLAALGGWFGYDGFVNYPKQDDAFFETRHLKRDSAIARQKQFMALAFLASLLIGGHVWKLSRFAFAWDDDGFTCDGRRHAYADVKSTDRKLWEKKGIIFLELVDGSRIKLDAWHHAGVKDFVKKLG